MGDGAGEGAQSNASAAALVGAESSGVPSSSSSSSSAAVVTQPGSEDFLNTPGIAQNVLLLQMIASQRFPDAFQNLQKAMELFGAQFASNPVPVPPLNGPNQAANTPDAGLLGTSTGGAAGAGAGQETTAEGASEAQGPQPPLLETANPEASGGLHSPFSFQEFCFQFQLEAAPNLANNSANSSSSSTEETGATGTPESKLSAFGKRKRKMKGDPNSEDFRKRPRKT